MRVEYLQKDNTFWLLHVDHYTLIYKKEYTKQHVRYKLSAPTSDDVFPCNPNYLEKIYCCNIILRHKNQEHFPCALA